MKKLLCVFVGIIFSYIVSANPIPSPWWVDVTSLQGSGDSIIEDFSIYETKLYSVGAFSNGLAALNSAGGYDVFVGCSPGLPTNVEITSYAGFGGAGDDYAYRIAVDNSGYRYITGYFEATAYFGIIALTSVGGKDLFVVKLDPSNNVVWAKRAGGSADEIGFGLGVDSNGDTYVTGQYTGQISFGSLVLSSAGGLDIFCAKLDGEGNWLWVKRAGGSGNDNVSNMTTDAEGNSYIAGSFQGYTAFSSNVLSSAGGSDVYVAKISPSGSWLWASRFGGDEDDIVDDISFLNIEQDELSITGLHTSLSEFPEQANGTVAFYADLTNTGQWLESGFCSNATEYFGTVASGVIPQRYAYGVLTVDELFGYGFQTEPRYYIGSLASVWFDGEPIICTDVQQSSGFVTALSDRRKYVYLSGGFIDTVFYTRNLDFNPYYYTQYLLHSPSVRSMYIAVYERYMGFSPVELTSFTALATSQNNVQLTWVSQSESDMLGYRVYRNSSDVQAGSELITPVLIPATNTSSQQVYSHTDDEVEIGSTYYYWLESVEMTTNDYYGPVSVVVEGSVTPPIPETTTLSSIRPNPFHVGSTAVIDANLRAGENGTLTIYGLRGQTVRQYSLHEGLNTVSWDGKDSHGEVCGSGIYYYRLATPSLYQNKKLIIIK